MELNRVRNKFVYLVINFGSDVMLRNMMEEKNDFLGKCYRILG